MNFIPLAAGTRLIIASQEEVIKKVLKTFINNYKNANYEIQQHSKTFFPESMPVPFAGMDPFYNGRYSHG
jgi:hypothetical protein